MNKLLLALMLTLITVPDLADEGNDGKKRVEKSQSEQPDDRPWWVTLWDLKQKPSYCNTKTEDERCSDASANLLAILDGSQQ